MSKYLITLQTDNQVNQVFNALNDPTRRAILDLLQKGDMTAGEIADEFNISKPSISHHLDLLKRAKLVSSVKEGQFIRYSLSTTELDELVKWIYKLRKGK